MTAAAFSRFPGNGSPPATPARFHELISMAAETEVPIPGYVCSLFGLSPEQRLVEEDLRWLISIYSASMMRDAGREAAEAQADSLLAWLNSRRPPQTYGGFAEEIAGACELVAARWCRLLTAFVNFLLVCAIQNDVENVLFLARDGIPFYVIAKRLLSRSSCSVSAKLVDLNRSMICQAMSFSRKHPNGNPGELFLGGLPTTDWRGTPLHTYLKTLLPQEGRVALVETGLYGTLIKLLVDTGLVDCPLVLFFASKNPHIFGYLNSVLGDSGSDGVRTNSELATICCDSVEAWPKPYTSSEVQTHLDEPLATAELMDFISVCASLVLYRGLAQGCGNVDMASVDLLQELRDVSKMGICDTAALPILLASPLPVWKHAQQWLQSWDLGPLAPIHGCNGKAR